MDRTALVNCFQDTLNMCNSPKLYLATEKAKKATKVYKENFSSKEIYSHLKSENFTESENLAEIIVKEGTSFATAKQYIKFGKTAVLNFANPHNAGGGVQNGAMAQEECLCRSSNLYPCLLTKEAQEEYYNYNKTNADYFFTDRVVYSENVTVFKDDNNVPVLMPENDWFYVSIITCAAPYIAERQYIDETALKELLKKRIKNIFEVALDNHIKVLILGAFGCGAFKNPPEIVAKAFREVIEENEYRKLFCKIVFAIKSTVNNASYKSCPNIAAFESAFCDISQSIYDLKNPYKDSLQYKGKNSYKGKKFSIFGDSISTLEGFNPYGYNVFYTGEICIQSGIRDKKDTWWGKVIDFFEGELLVNNSWSGSRVTKLPDYENLFPSGCCDERTSALHNDFMAPDVILIYLGTNDWAFHATLEPSSSRWKEIYNYENFDFAYDRMLKKLKKNYPSSEIWCCTLCETCIPFRPEFCFPHEYSGIHIDRYNDVIRKITRQNQCYLIDFYNYKTPYSSLDGTHPDKTGMSMIAEMVIQAMAEFDAKQSKGCGNIYQKNSFKTKLTKEEKIGDFDELVGTIIDNKYLILESLNFGSVNKNYLIQNNNSNQLWNMNAYEKSMIYSNSVYSEILIREIDIMKSLRHPAIPSIIDIIDSEKYFFVIREYIEGVKLSVLLKNMGAQPYEKVIGWAIQLCDVLHYLHTLNPPHIYRDMNPGNILLTPNGSLKLIDFQATRLYVEGKPRDTQFLGRIGYAAPEQFGDAQTDVRTDIYGLGMTLYHLVTGMDPAQPPYEVRPVCQWNPNLPKGLEYIIAKCTQINPAMRYQSCDELIKDLNDYTNLPKPKGFLNKIFRKK